MKICLALLSEEYVLLEFLKELSWTSLEVFGWYQYLYQLKISTLNTNTVRYSERRIYHETNLTKLIEQFKSTTGKEFDMKQISNIKVTRVGGLSLEKINALIKELQEQRRSMNEEQASLTKEEDTIRDS